MSDFARSLLLTEAEVEWELAKFKDHLEARYRKPPKDAVAAFRNWLRRSIEINRANLGRNRTTNYSQSNSYEQFLSGLAKLADEKKDELKIINPIFLDDRQTGNEG